MSHLLTKYLQIGDSDVVRVSHVVYYKDEMGRLIDIIKNKSFGTPSQSSLENMKMMTIVVKRLNDRT